jgi:multiple sugar transport system permease protein
MFIASVRNNREFLNEPDRIVPTSLTLRNYEALFSQRDFIDSVLLSAEVALGCTVIALVLAATFSYSLARYHIRGMKLVRGVSIWAYLFPPVVVAIPFFILLRSIGLQDTVTGLLLAHVAFCFPFAMWLLYPFMRSLPLGLEESAAADGATVLRTLWHVVLPVALPGILAVAAFCFSLSWSDYLFARVLLGGGNRTLPVFIFDLHTSTIVDWGMLMAAGTISVVPVAVIVALTHRHLTTGFAAAGIRG